MREYKPVKPPTSPEKTCKTWAAEAAMRMLMNNLSEEVAEKPEELIIYGGTGKAARNWECYDAIVKSLKELEPDETLLVQSGKPVGIFRTFPDSPRVLIANAHIVPQWASWENFRELERMGLTMFGQMTAGSWIYIGTQGIVQGTYETFAAAADKHFDGSLKGKLLVSGGLGGMGGAQPLAATMAGATFLGADPDEKRIKRRIETGYCDEMTDDIKKAVSLAMKWKKEGKARSVGVVANIVDLLTELVNQNITPEILTDQTSAHDELNGYIPRGVSFEEAIELRHTNPDIYVNLSLQTMAEHVRLMLQLKDRGAITFDYGNNLRGQAQRAGLNNAFDYPGFVPEFIRPLFCLGKGPFRWATLSGDPQDIYATDKAALELFPEDKVLSRWLKLANEKIKFQGLPARICWLGYGDRARFGLKINEMVKSGEIKGPIVIGRDHLDGGSVASPHRETENMKDNSDVIADWPLLNGLLNAVSGASWVSIHHGGGVGIGQSIHAGLVIVADGTDEAAARLERVLTNDPGTGVMRHVDAGYEDAIKCARERGVKIPLLPEK